MKRFSTFFATLLALTCWLSVAHTQDASTWIPDANLRNAVRTALMLNADEPLTQQKMLNLTTLSASQQEITDLTGLEYATNLKALLIAGNRIRKLKPLANLTHLTRLYIGGNRIRNLRPLANLTNLKRLGILQNQISDISTLAGLVSLRYLRLEGNPITDTSPLTSLPKLSDVDIEIPSFIPDANLRAAVRAALGIEASLRITIDAMRNLTTLNASKLGITDLMGLEHATYLNSLWIGSNRISDLTPLSNLRRLKTLYINNNRIRNIRSLANLTGLRRLGILQNQISDISVLAGLVSLRHLRLAGNPITDLTPLTSLPRLVDVDVVIPRPPQNEVVQGMSEQTQTQEPKVDPPPDDGEQTQGGQQDDSGRSDDSTPQDGGGQQQQQQPDQNNGQQQQQQQQDPPSSQNNGGQQQQPDQNNGQQQQQQQQQQDPPQDPPDEDRKTQFQIECEEGGGTYSNNGEGGEICFTPIPSDIWDELSPRDAPSINSHKMFIMDRLTLEQLDPATLETQFEIWHTESDGSALYLRSIALLESVLAAMRPDKTQLLPNYPNPFNPETWIPYHLANPSDVTITIYEARGTVVRQLDLGHQQEGYYTSRSRAVYWDGTNHVGERVASGIYFYQLQADNVSTLRKMVILK